MQFGCVERVLLGTSFREYSLLCYFCDLFSCFVTCVLCDCCVCDLHVCL